MSNNHYGGNIQPALDVEEHDGANNAKRVRVVAGNITLDAGDIQIGAVEIKNSADDTRATVGANGLSVDVKALVALPAGVNNIGFASVTPVQAWPDPKTYIGLVTVANTVPMTLSGNVTIDSGNISLRGNVTLSDPRGYIGLVSIAQPISATFGGNVTLNPSGAYIGLASVNIGGTLPALAAGAAYIGLASVNIGGSLPAGANYIGSVTVANAIAWPDPRTYIGLVTISGAVDTELPAATALADATANPTTPGVGIYPHDFNGTTWDRRRHSFTQTTTGITAASSGTAIDMTTDPQKMFAITAKMQGDTSTFDVRLEGSLDNTNFAELVAITNITPGDGKLGFAIDKPILYVRYRVAGITRATGTLDIKILATE